MKLFKLLSGTHDGHKDGERHRYVKGDHVPLSDAQYKAFKDKFEEVLEDAPKTKTVQKAEVPAVKTEQKTEQTQQAAS